MLTNVRNRWRRASDDTTRALRIKLADHGSPLRFMICVALIVMVKVFIYPSLTTAVEPIGNGGIDFVGCALIGNLPSVLLHPFAGYLPVLPRLLAEAIGSVLPPLYLPQAFYWLSLITGALFCALLVLPQFATAMPSTAARIGAALFLGTYPDYASNLPENIAVLGFIPLLWLGLVAAAADRWAKILPAAAAGGVLMLSKPVLLIAAPAFLIAGVAAVVRRHWRAATFNTIVCIAAILQIAYMIRLGSFAGLTRGIHALDIRPFSTSPIKNALFDFADTLGKAIGGGHVIGMPLSFFIAVAAILLLAIGAFYTLRHARTRADLYWVFGSAALIAAGTLAANAVTATRFSGETRYGLPLVIALTAIFVALQPFERVTWARRTGWVIALALIAGTAGNLPRSHDPIDPAKGYTDWERTYFLAENEHFAIPVDADDNGPGLWLMEKEAGFLNSDGDVMRGKPLPLGGRPAADFTVDSARYRSQGFLGAIVPLRANQAAKPVEMDVINAAGDRKKASIGIPLPNGSRYFLLDRPISAASAIHFSIDGTPEKVSPAIALIGETPRAPSAEEVCAIPALFRSRGL